MRVPAGWSSEDLASIASGGLFTDGDWVETKDQDPSGDVRLTQLADVGVGEFRGRSHRWLREDQAKRLNCTFLHPVTSLSPECRSRLAARASCRKDSVEP